MYFTATVTAYDMLDRVGVTANVYAYDQMHQEHAENVLHTSTVVQGEGEGDPREWLKEALVALLETL